MKEEKLIESVVAASKYAFETKLVSGRSGNISARFKDNSMDLIAITPTNVSLSDITEKNVVIVDIEGNILSKGTPSTELDLHLEIYNKRDDIYGIVHTHSPCATGFAFSNKRLKRLEGFGKIEIKYFEELDYEKPGSIELANKASKKMINNDVLILKNHGIVTISNTVNEAVSLANFVEESAKTQYIAYQLNNMD